MEGKESAQMLLRELAQGRHEDWLKTMVFLIAPIYNADGNEKFALNNRGPQHGPMGGQGQRPNAQGFDLNRDHVKLDSPEGRAVVKLITKTIGRMNGLLVDITSSTRLPPPATALQDRASAVRTTERLVDSPACLVADAHALSGNLERILKAAGQDVPTSKPILEINAAHPIVKRLRNETDETRFADWSQILFDQATLAEGGQLDDPATFVKRLNELMLTLAGEGPSRIWVP